MIRARSRTSLRGRRGEVAGRVALAVTFALGAGCTSAPQPITTYASSVLLERLEPAVRAELPADDALPPHVIATGFDRTSVSEAEARAWNVAQTQYYREVEAPFYPSSTAAGAAPDDGWPAGLPRRCIAISGGGIRSSAFALGVLQELQARGSLDKVDVISSVSGGSYASSYLYASTLHLDPAEPDPLARILDPDGPQIAHLDRQAPYFVDLASLTGNTLGGILSQVLAVRHLPTCNAVPRFDGAHVGYAQDICKMYHRDRRASWADVRALLEARDDLPFPIINATVRTGDSPRCETRDPSDNTPDEPLALRAFEFTPLRHGSDALGYSDRRPPYSFSESVALSGAAVDDPGGALCRFLAFPGARLGSGITCFETAPRTWDGAANGEIPQERLAQHRIYLSDGAFADNLGAFAAFKRLCRHTLIIDSEHDPGLGYAGYQRLRNRLRDEMGATFEIGAIEDWLAENTKPCPDEPDRNCPPEGAFRADQLEQPVSAGTVRGFPFPGASSPLTLGVTYVKLGLDARRLDHYHSATRDFYQNQERTECSDGLIRRCPFPQESTVRQTYPAEEFRAYRQLGMDTVCLFSPEE